MARNRNRPWYRPKCTVAVIVRTSEGILLTKTVGQPFKFPSDIKGRKEAASEAAYRLLRAQTCLPRPSHLRVIKLEDSKRWMRCYEASYATDVVREHLCTVTRGGRDNTLAPPIFLKRNAGSVHAPHLAILKRLGYVDAARTE